MAVRDVAANGSLTDAEKRSLVQRVVHAPIFAGSLALRAFLLFVTEQAISGNMEGLKEQCIGREVLGRRMDYDPAGDNIVRVRARELRRRLGSYFASAGADEPFLISIPRGGYAPIFHLRSAPPLTEGPLSESSAPSGYVPACAAWTTDQWTAVRDLWGRFFPKANQALTVVTADAAFALWQDISGNNLSLGDYLSRKHLEMGDPRLREVAARRCIAPADLNICLRLFELSGALGGHVQSRYARDLSMSEFRTLSAVLIGSRRSNPWVQLFEQRLNFVLAFDASTGGPRFHNGFPLSDEPAEFAIPCSLDIEGTERREMESYALVALLPSLSGAGHVLLLEGLSMEGTEAAGEVATNPELLAALLRQIGHTPGTSVQPFEALIQITSFPGGFINPRVIAFRYSGGLVIA